LVRAFTADPTGKKQASESGDDGLPTALPDRVAAVGVVLCGQ
jgi:hypothetical protein